MDWSEELTEEEPEKPIEEEPVVIEAPEVEEAKDIEAHQETKAIKDKKFEGSDTVQEMENEDDYGF